MAEAKQGDVSAGVYCEQGPVHLVTYLGDEWRSLCDALTTLYDHELTPGRKVTCRKCLLVLRRLNKRAAQPAQKEGDGHGEGTDV
jgi:hypothetical protein